MLEKIPDYNQSHRAITKAIETVDLAPVVIKPSLLLHRLEIFIYLSMALAATIAISPFILVAFYWLFLWLVFLLVIVAALRGSLHAKQSNAISLSVAKTIWHLQTIQGDLIVKPCGEILVWEHVIILCLEETLNKQKHRIIALPDSMTTQEWRRLRVWLRLGLRKIS